MHFTSEAFADNGEPAKFELILKYFFLSQHNPNLLLRFIAKKIL